MVTLYSELLHGVLSATAQWLSGEVQIITVASTLKVNSCNVFISGVAVDGKPSMKKQLDGWTQRLTTWQLVRQQRSG